MSTISEKERAAIFGKLNVSGVTDLATGGVHFMIVPERDENDNLIVPPFVVFNRIPGTIDYALGNNIIGERGLWLIKAVVDKDSSATMSPAELAEAILTACDTAIGGTLTITGNVSRLARRASEMPPYVEQGTDRNYHHHGFFLGTYTSTD